MKRMVRICLIGLFLATMATTVDAIEYGMDILEKGNSGGWSASLKTFDQKGGKSLDKEVVIDVWVRNVPEELITAGFWLSFDASKVNITTVEIFDGSVLPGPWDKEMSKKVPNPSGPGTYLIITGNLGNVKPDKNSDIILARVKCLCQDKVTKPIEVSPIKGFDTVVGSNGKVFDPTIKAATFAIH